MKSANEIQARRAKRMAKIQKRRGRTPSKAVGAFITDPLRKGKKLFQVYGLANAQKLSKDKII